MPPANGLPSIPIGIRRDSTSAIPSRRRGDNRLTRADPVRVRPFLCEVFDHCLSHDHKFGRSSKTAKTSLKSVSTRSITTEVPRAGELPWFALRSKSAWDFGLGWY